MGVIMVAQCKKCEFSKQLFLGGGLKDCEMKTLSAVIPKKKYWQLKAALSKMPPGGFSIDRRPALCQNCKILCAVPIVQFRNADGMIAREITGLCPECEGEVNFFATPDSAKTPVPCPACGAELKFEESGHWD